MNYSTRFQAGGLAKSSYLPFKVNSAGVMPIIFASSLLALPATLARFAPNPVIIGAAKAVYPAAWPTFRSTSLSSASSTTSTLSSSWSPRMWRTSSRGRARHPGRPPWRRHQRVHHQGPRAPLDPGKRLPRFPRARSHGGGGHHRPDHLPRIRRHVAAHSRRRRHGHHPQGPLGDCDEPLRYLLGFLQGHAEKVK